MFLHAGTIGTELFSNPGPENIFRKEGESSIFIPCPFFYGLSIPVWIINDATYGTQTLPDSYVAFADGLLVTIALRQLNGTTFQCYTEIGLEVFKSSIGTLFIELDGLLQIILFISLGPIKSSLKKQKPCTKV